MMKNHKDDFVKKCLQIKQKNFNQISFKNHAKSIVFTFFNGKKRDHDGLFFSLEIEVIPLLSLWR